MKRVAKVGILLAWLLVISAPVAAQNTWVTLASMPEVREGFACDFSSAQVGGIDQARIYVTHGFSGGDNNDTRAYDIPTDTWLALASAPTSRSELAGAEHGGLIYAIGGRFGAVLSTVERYDPTTDSWATLASMPTARAGLGVAVLGNKIYAVGGRTGTNPGSGTALGVIEEYNIAKNTWRTGLRPMPVAVMDTAAVAFGGKIYVMGGATGTNPLVDGPVVGNVQIYNPRKDTWTTGTAMQIARANLYLVHDGSRILALGGRNVPGLGVRRLGTVEEYNPRTDAWRTLDSIPTPRSEHCAVFHGGKVYVMGSGIFGASLSAHEALIFSSTRP